MPRATNVERGGDSQPQARRHKDQQVKQRPPNEPTVNQQTYHTEQEAAAVIPQIIKTYGPRIAALTGIPTQSNIHIAFTQPGALIAQGAAARAIGGPGSNGLIQIDPTAVIGMSKDELTGLVVHEMTHQNLGLTGNISGDEGPQKMFVEGLADYVRDAVLPDSGKGNSGYNQNQADSAQDPSVGYQGSAAFFQYIEKAHPGAIKGVIAALENGDEGALVDATGQSFDELMQGYKTATTVTQPEKQADRAAYHERMQSYNQAWHDFINDPTDLISPMRRPPTRGLESFAPIGMHDASTQPPHLSPKYAAGPNPGISEIENPTPPADTGYSPLAGFLASGAQNLGLEGAPVRGQRGSTDRQTMDAWVNPNPPAQQPPSGNPPSGNPPSGNPPSGNPPSSSTTSSAPATPPVDPRVAQLESLFRSAYIQLWAEPPTEGYIKQAAQSGMNVTEFVARERKKDDWQFTKAYKDEAKGLYAALRQMGGV